MDIDAQQVNITGDVVGGDKVGGDKVLGDKITHEAPKPIVPALHQLPPPPLDFTGRADDIAAILDDIAHGAIISGVRGMGGIGKTALALVIADCVKAQYPDAQFFLALRGASESPVKPLDAMQAVIRAYHPTAQLPDDAAQIAALYQSVLADQRAIVLLDDARDAAQIRPLLPLKSCLVLITTRNTFTVPGLHTRKLETLSSVEARDLLIAIAPPLVGVILSREAAKDLFANQPEILRAFGAQNDTVPVVDVIAYFCGYLPLALRAAASLIAATPDLNPYTYAAQLRDERTRLTKIGAEGVDVDVAASLNLSYAQLSPEAARVFRLLSVFPADFDAAAEEAVCEDADHAHLSQLVRLSLVEYETPTPTLPRPQETADRGGSAGRYRLHDLVRLFAANLLPSPVDALFIDGGRAGDGGSSPAYRHAAYYKDVLQQAKELYKQGNDNVLQGLALFDREWLNIQAGQAWAVMHLKDNADAARLCNEYADNWYVLNIRLHPREFIRWLESAESAARQLQRKDYEGVHLGNLGLAYFTLGETRKAIEFDKQALAVARDIGDKRNEGAWLGNLGLAYFTLGEARKAITFHEQALIIDREIGNRRGEGQDLGNLGLAYAALGETQKAIEFYQQALIIDREIGDRRGEGAALGNLGSAYYALGETQKAIEFYQQALIIDREICDRRGEGASQGNLGSAYYALGETQKAIEFYEQHRDIARTIGDRLGEGNALGNLGNAYADLGETRKAIEFYEQRLVIARAIGDRRGESNALWNMALALDELHERAQAIAISEAALKIYKAIEDPNEAMVRQALAEWKA